MKGKLTIVTGPMFAGKTTALLEAASAFSPNAILLYKPSIDTRYSKTSIVSHNGKELPALLVDRENPNFKSDLTDAIRAVFIDELNFFEFNKIAPRIKELLSEGITVFGSGLSYDFEKKPFGAVLPLTQIADSVITLTAICDFCGGKAIHSYRKKKLKEYLVVGGAELYGACCEPCFEAFV